MSLINDVLKKLEHRHGNSANEPNQTFAKQAKAPDCYKEPTCHMSILFFCLFGVAIIMAAGYFANHYFTQQRLKQHYGKVLLKHLPLATPSTATPNMVALANPPLQALVNSSLPPPSDLQEKIRPDLKLLTSGTKTLATPINATPATINLPVSALQASVTPASVVTGDDSFSLVETHDNNAAVDQQLTYILNLAKMGQMAHAEQLFSQLPSATNEQSKVVLHAKLLSLQNKNTEAIAILIAFNQQNKATVDTLGMLAALFQETGQSDKAIIIYQQLVNYCPDNPIWWLGLAISAMDIGQHALAISAFQHEINFQNELSPEVSSYVQKTLSMLMTRYPNSA